VTEGLGAVEGGLGGAFEAVRGAGVTGLFVRGGAAVLALPAAVTGFFLGEVSGEIAFLGDAEAPEPKSPAKRLGDAAGACGFSAGAGIEAGGGGGTFAFGS